MNVEEVWMRENENEETALCDVCLEKDYTEGNELVFCVVCRLAVHIYCYGEPLRSDYKKGCEI